MKKLLLFIPLVTITLLVRSQFQQISTNPAYTQGAGHGFVKNNDGTVTMVTSSDVNVGNPQSHYLTNFTCPNMQFALTLNNLASSVNRCINGPVEGKRPGIDTSVFHGNGISTVSNENIVFWKAIDATQKIYAPYEMFKFTDGNKADASIDGAVFFKDSIRIWYNAYQSAPHAINGTTLTQVNDASLLSGIVIPRPDLAMAATSPSFGKVQSISNTSAGELITLGLSTNVGTLSGPIAQNGYFYNLTTGLLTNAGIPGNGYTKGYIECQNFGFIGNHSTDGLGGFNVGLVKVDPTTHVKSTTTAYGILSEDLASRGNEVFVGGIKLMSMTSGGVMGIYNVLTNSWTPNLTPNGTLFTAVNAASAIYHLIDMDCPNCLYGYAIMIDGNMGIPSQPSNFNYTSKYCPSGPLSVKLVSFVGEKSGEGNMLTWKTENEINNKGFEVQRSLDGIKYDSIWFSTSIATSSVSSFLYMFKDIPAPKGTVYYRLKQVDMNGRTTLSSVVVIKDNIVDLVVDKIYPNPVVFNLNVVINSPKQQAVNLRITTMLGSVVYNQIHSLQKGSNAISLDFTKLSSGVYILNAGDAQAQKVIKQ